MAYLDEIAEVGRDLAKEADIELFKAVIKHNPELFFKVIKAIYDVTMYTKPLKVERQSEKERDIFTVSQEFGISVNEIHSIVNSQREVLSLQKRLITEQEGRKIDLLLYEADIKRLKGLFIDLFGIKKQVKEND